MEYDVQNPVDSSIDFESILIYDGFEENASGQRRSGRNGPDL